MTLRIALGQIDAIVGDIAGNLERVLTAWREAADAGSDLIVFTELTITGYPPEDLLLKPEFLAANLAALDTLAAEGPAGTVAVVGYVGTDANDDVRPQNEDTVSALDLHNSAAVIGDGRVVARYNKWRLPNYGVFDEARYFVSDDDVVIVEISGVPVGITICEDLWVETGPLTGAAAAGATVIANLNASPYHRGKRSEREHWVRHHATSDDTWVIYVNTVGGQDEVVFDGDSMVCSPAGDIVARGAQFADDVVVVDLAVEPGHHNGALADATPRLDGFTAAREALPAATETAALDPVAEVWEALVRATRDYCHKNGFRDALVALSGGIDSAVTVAIAVDALGSEHVTGVALPSPHSSDHSLGDAKALAANLGITYHVIPIAPAMTAFETMLVDVFAGLEPGVAEENIQARSRGVTMMALSNKLGSLLLTTGNKTEMAVGYATLYGDMAGAFAPLKDVLKMLVYDLARHRNRDGGVIPEGTITKPPSAELRPGQFDDDSLPPYPVLDDIVAGYVEDDLGVRGIVARGHERELVEHIVALIDRAEFKRRQAPPGTKITERAFGRDRRVPITSGWRGVR